MKDNFYTSHIIGILIWLLIVLICMLAYIIIDEEQEKQEIKINHAIIIKWQEKQHEKIDYIYNSLKEFDLECVE